MAKTFTKIAFTKLTSAASTISFTSIPATYDDLCIKAVLRSDRSGQQNSSARITFNSTSTNLNYFQVINDKATIAVNSDTAGPLMYIPAATWSVNFVGYGHVYIPSYTASFEKTFMMYAGFSQNSSNSSFGHFDGARWDNTAAITTVTFTEANGANFITNSSLTLYGIKRA